MTHLLFGLTVLYMIYVLYEVFKTVADPKAAFPAPAGESLPEPRVEAPCPADPPARPAPARSAPARSASAGEGERGPQLRNPLNGEISPMPTNYRFAKKWIKDALVAEGLLDRVYKPSELDETVSQKVKEALDKFKNLERYQA
ncbi:hypothetical protein [Candidatus Methylocalor cossyra]|uniref:Uncharacterized protein n=1 Tax=Candidatus Methylocalor cossyra TaxID=3108543 RepID=A0ABM9NE32_9GAMM